MDIDPIDLLFRWMHILAAIMTVGGAIFMRFALLPSISVLNDDQRTALYSALRIRWSKIVQVSIGFLILSGLYNYIMLTRAARDWPTELPRYYHMLFGIKFLLALGVFFLASVLSGRSSGTERFRQNAKFWLTTNVILAVAVVCISGAMRMTHVGPNITNLEERASK